MIQLSYDELGATADLDRLQTNSSSEPAVIKFSSVFCLEKEFSRTMVS